MTQNAGNPYVMVTKQNSVSWGGFPFSNQSCGCQVMLGGFTRPDWPLKVTTQLRFPGVLCDAPFSEMSQQPWILWPEPNSETHRTETVGTQTWSRNPGFYLQGQTGEGTSRNDPAKPPQME